ncbi:hypothetical protein WR25_10241 [Diploscapter pachys]|uniref:RING-type E3 ubiquitin transferase BRCA1 n=1 Tax=Diploscapter pachys TaxID=2018661 RepID=A0A2A2KCQ4_9BILA|nr:hypothetical protein WR25_10241 [Diploscapter pachys]
MSVDLKQVGEEIDVVLGEMQAQLKCPLCHSTLNAPVLTNCNHAFCKMCLEDSFRQSTACPLCRVALNKRSCTISTQLEAAVKAYLQLAKGLLRDRTENRQMLPQIRKEVAFQESQAIVDMNAPKSPIRDFRIDNNFVVPKDLLVKKKRTQARGSAENPAKLRKVGSSGEAQTVQQNRERGGSSGEATTSNAQAEKAERRYQSRSPLKQPTPESSKRSKSTVPSAQPRSQMSNDSPQPSTSKDTSKPESSPSPVKSSIPSTSNSTNKRAEKTPQKESTPFTPSAVEKKPEKNQEEKKIYVVTSKITSRFLDNLVYEFTMLFRGMTSSPPVVVQKQFDENTTHFVFLQSSDEGAMNENSVEYCLAIAWRCTVLQRQWMEEIVQTGQFLDPDPFKITQGKYTQGDQMGWIRRLADESPGIFQGKSFKLREDAFERKIKKETVVQLIEKMGGKILKRTTGTENGYVIFGIGSNEISEAKTLELGHDNQLLAVGAEFVLASIARYELQEARAFRVASVAYQSQMKRTPLQPMPQAVHQIQNSPRGN